MLSSIISGTINYQTLEMSSSRFRLCALYISYTNLGVESSEASALDSLLNLYGMVESLGGTGYASVIRKHFAYKFRHYVTVSLMLFVAS